MFRTCARAGAAAGVSHPASHNEEEHSFDVFIHAASVYIFTDSSRAHHVQRHCGGGVKHSLGQMGQTAKRKKKTKKKVTLLSPVRPCSTMVPYKTPRKLPTFRGSGVGVGSLEAWWFLAERENRVQPA